MPHRLVQWIVAILGLAVIAGGGWFISTLQGQQQQLVQRLSASQSSLTKREETLTLLEDERGKLSKSYDALKARWEQCDHDVQQLAKNSEQLKNELASISSERSGMQQRLDEAKDQRSRLEAKLGDLKEAIGKKDTDRVALEAKFQKALRELPTREEMTTLTETLAQREEEQHRLRALLSDVSQAYERLTQQVHTEEQQAAQAPALPMRPGMGRIPVESQELAWLYWSLGEEYLVNHQYPSAAEAFERSLAIEDDPTLHAKLAYIYGRLLHDVKKAQYHEALAPSVDPARAGLYHFAAAQGYPRKSSRLVWRWLSGQ